MAKPSNGYEEDSMGRLAVLVSLAFVGGAPLLERQLERLGQIVGEATIADQAESKGR